MPSPVWVGLIQSVEGLNRTNLSKGALSLSWDSISDWDLYHQPSCFPGLWTQTGTYTIHSLGPPADRLQIMGLLSLHHQVSQFLIIKTSLFLSVSLSLCIYILMCIYVYVHRCVYIYVYIYIFVYICIFIDVYRCIYVYRCVYICICIYVYRYVCMYMYIDVYTHTHTHTHAHWFPGEP